MLCAVALGYGDRKPQLLLLMRFYCVNRSVCRHIFRRDHYIIAHVSTDGDIIIRLGYINVDVLVASLDPR